MADIKYHYVTLKGVPLPEDQKEKSLRGYHKPNTKDVYLIKGKSDEVDKFHEEYHAIKNHPDFPKDPKDFVRHEVEANLYAYEKIGKPVVINDDMGYWQDYLIKYYKDDIHGAAHAFNVIGEVLREYNIPSSWEKCYDHSADEIYGGRKIPEYQVKFRGSKPKKYKKHKKKSLTITDQRVQWFKE